MENEVAIPEWKTRPWHLSTFNNGYEVHYVGGDLMSHVVPFEFGDDGHSENKELLLYIVKLHNTNLEEW